MAVGNLVVEKQVFDYLAQPRLGESLCRHMCLVGAIHVDTRSMHASMPGWLKCLLHVSSTLDGLSHSIALGLEQTSYSPLIAWPLRH